MLYIILLLILAVLLFGSSAVLGVFGTVLGFIVAAIALIWLSIAFDVPPSTILLCAGGAFGVLLVIGVIANDKTAENQRKIDALWAKMSPEERKNYERLRNEASAKVKAERESRGR